MNALSASFDVETRYHGRCWVQRYAAGDAQGPLHDVGATASSGVTFRFLPDPTIFHMRRFDRDDLQKRFEEIRRDTQVPLELKDLR